MNVEKIRGLIRDKTGDEALRLGEDQLRDLARFLARRDARDYLTDCLLEEGYHASGVYVCSVGEMREENLWEAAPGAYIFPHGYLVFATSVGGNALCLHDASGRVYWADHDAFSDTRVTYRNPETGEYEDLPPTAENVRQAMVPVSDNLEEFLVDLLRDKLTAKLNELD